MLSLTPGMRLVPEQEKFIGLKKQILSHKGLHGTLNGRISLPDKALQIDVWGQFNQQRIIQPSILKPCIEDSNKKAGLYNYRDWIYVITSNHSYQKQKRSSSRTPFLFSTFIKSNLFFYSCHTKRKQGLYYCCK